MNEPTKKVRTKVAVDPDGRERHTIYVDEQAPLAKVVLRPSGYHDVHILSGPYDLERLKRLKITVDHALAILGES